MSIVVSNNRPLPSTPEDTDKEEKQHYISLLQSQNVEINMGSSDESSDQPKETSRVNEGMEVTSSVVQQLGDEAVTATHQQSQVVNNQAEKEPTSTQLQSQNLDSNDNLGGGALSSIVPGDYDNSQAPTFLDDWVEVKVALERAELNRARGGQVEMTGR